MGKCEIRNSLNKIVAHLLYRDKSLSFYGLFFYVDWNGVISAGAAAALGEKVLTYIV